MGSIYQAAPPVVVKESGATADAEWTPDPLWPDMEALLATYAGTYATRMACVVSTSHPTLNLMGAAAYRTSDAPATLKTAGGVHTWDDTNISADSQGRRFRWVIYYYNAVDVAFSTGGMIPVNAMYAVFDGCNITGVGCFCVNSAISADVLRQLESFALIHGANTSSISDFSYFGANMGAMRQLPKNLDTSSGTNFNNFCAGSGIRYLPENLATSRGTNFASFCLNTPIERLPENLDTSNGTAFGSFCGTCTGLHTIPRRMNCSKGTTMNMFTSRPAIVNGSLYGISVSANISVAMCLSPDFLVQTIRDLADVSASPKTLTIGADHLAKISTTYAADIAAAQAKGWTIV